MPKFEANEVMQDKVANLTKLIDVLIATDADIEKAEAQLKEIKARRAQLSDEMIPNAFAEAGVSELKLPDGKQVTVKPFYSASINEEFADQAFKWLEDNGHGALIKHNLICAFDRTDTAAVEKCRAILDGANIQYGDEQKVHPQTLKAFVKEQVEAGEPIPTDLLGVHIGQKTYIKKG